MFILNHVGARNVTRTVKVVVVLLSLFIYGCKGLSVDPDYSAETELRPVVTTTFVGEKEFTRVIDNALKETGVDARAGARKFLETSDRGERDYSLFRELSVAQLDGFLRTALAEAELADQYSYQLSNDFAKSSRVTIQDKNGNTDGFLSNVFSSISSVLLMQEILALSLEKADNDPVKAGELVASMILELNPAVLKVCEDAFQRRLDEFRNGVGSNHLSFGMVTDDDVMPYEPAEVAKGGIWAGPLKMCSWIGAVNNYFYEFEFTADKYNKDAGSDFPLTLVSTDDIMASPSSTEDGIVTAIREGILGVVKQSILDNGWKWKLHATGEHIKINRAVEATRAAPAGIDITNDFQIAKNCFDIFFREIPRSENGESYFSQLDGYCNGRCDERIVNSGI